MLRNDVLYEFPPGCDGALILERLAQVLDPELDESILQLGFIRSLHLHDGHATVALQLPTSWCAANFAYLMAEEIRRALLTVEQIQQVTVRLGDHFAAEAIETAVNAGRPFDEAFPGEGCESLDALRATFLRKGFTSRQARVLQELRTTGLSPGEICGLRVGDVSMHGATCLARTAVGEMVTVGSATTMERYLERRRELGLDCTPTAPLVIDLRGQPLSGDRLEAYYRAARTVRVSLEANGSFCRAVLAVRQDVPQDVHTVDERRA